MLIRLSLTFCNTLKQNTMYIIYLFYIYIYKRENKYFLCHISWCKWTKKYWLVWCYHSISYSQVNHIHNGYFLFILKNAMKLVFIHNIHSCLRWWCYFVWERYITCYLCPFFYCNTDIKKTPCIWPNILI